MTLSFFMSALVPSFRLKRCVHNYEMIQSLEIILDTRNGKITHFQHKMRTIGETMQCRSLHFEAHPRKVEKQY